MRKRSITETMDIAALTSECKSLAATANEYWVMSWYLGANPSEVAHFQQESANYYRAAQRVREIVITRMRD